MTAVGNKANTWFLAMTWWTCTACWNTTQDTGVNVYTTGEMLPAHMYPKLKAFKHLEENYGTAWHAQKLEFATFTSPIVVTKNCIVEPRKKYCVVFTQ